MGFKCGGDINLVVYADAAWAVHDDAHVSWLCCTRMVVQAEDRYFELTDSEIAALCDVLVHMMWYKKWLGAQGHELGPIPVLQGNSACIDLMRDECKTSQRTKHLDVRLFWAHDVLIDDTIDIIWCKTEDMIADLMTKPLLGTLFKRHGKLSTS